MNFYDLSILGLKAGYNILIDGSLRDAKWYSYYINNLKAHHANLRLAIIHVFADDLDAGKSSGGNSCI